MICSSDSFVLFTSFALAWQLQNFVTVGPRQTLDGAKEFEEPRGSVESEVSTRRRDVHRAEPLYPEIPSLESPFYNYKVGRGDTTLIGISDGWLDKMIPRGKDTPTTLAFSPDPVDELEGYQLAVELPWNLQFPRYVNETTSNSGDENSLSHEASTTNVEREEGDEETVKKSACYYSHDKHLDTCSP